MNLDDVERHLNRRWSALGFASLLSEEQGYVALWLLDAEVNNGGLHQYLTNNAGDTALKALDTLAQLGSKETLDILREALQLLDPVGGYSVDRTERWNRVDALPDACDQLAALDAKYYASADCFLDGALGRVSEAYARERISLLPNSSLERTRGG